MEVYPEIDITMLGNVFDAAGKDTEIAKKVRTLQITQNCAVGPVIPL